MQLLLVMIGGAFGSGARYLLSDFTQRKSPLSVALNFPVGTLTVNLLGCLVFGVTIGLWRSGLISENWRLFLLAGVCGGFTTFSAFSSDTLELIYVGREGFALINVAVQVIAGLFVLWAGMVVTQRLS